jgi:DHA1 family inner membrane transport protein
VLGIFAGLELAGRFGWHGPFLMLGACAAVNLVLASFALPPIQTAVLHHQPWRQMREIVSHRVHRWAFAVGAVLIMAGGVLIPFLAPSFIVNVGIDEVKELKWVYAVGGTATFITTPLVGWLSDHMDRLRLLALMSGAAILVTLVITRLGPSSLPIASMMMALFMVTMSGRFAPAMTMITNAVESRYRGGFMSVNAALQQAASGLANILAGFFVTLDPSGHFIGFPTLGYVAVGFFVLTVLLAVELRAIAPHVSAPARKLPLEAATELAA